MAKPSPKAKAKSKPSTKKDVSVKDEQAATYTTDSPEVNAVLIAEKTMLGDLMKLVLEQAKSLKKPWEQLGESEQEQYFFRSELQCRAAVQKCIDIIISQGRVTIPATVDSVTFKGGVKAVLMLAPGAEGRHDLSDAEGHTVNICLIHAEHLTEGGGKPKAVKDQPSLLAEDEAEPDDGEDTLLSRARDYARSAPAINVSAFQRHLQVGYNRAARLIEALEAEGVITGLDESGKRHLIDG